VGAVEFQGTNTPLPYVSPDALNFGSVGQTTTSAAQTLTVTNPTAAALPITVTFAPTGPFTRAGGNCTGSLAAGASCTLTIVFNAPALTGTPPAPVTVNATLTLGAAGAIGGSPVSLTGTSVPAPTLTSVAPNTGFRGSSVAVTLTGANFSTLGSTVNVGAGITVSNVSIQSPTTITATFTVAANAALGARNVSVTTGGITTGTVTFTIASPPRPTVTSIVPNAHARGGGVFAVTLTGTNFTTGSTVGVSGNGVVVSGTTLVNSTTITANFTVLGNAQRNARNVTVTTPGGTSLPVTFTVQ
jgi:hypothetical protein